jgi:hypothetical protein
VRSADPLSTTTTSSQNETEASARGRLSSSLSVIIVAEILNGRSRKHYLAPGECAVLYGGRFVARGPLE